MITLGSRVKDLVTGFEGIAIARTVWLHGCARISVQPVGLSTEGKRFEQETFDEPQLLVVAAGSVDEFTSEPARAEPAKLGGPRPEVTRAATPSQR